MHCFAAFGPAALRGDWEVASAHVRMATEAAQAVGELVGQSARPPPPGRSWPWPGAILRASPTPPQPLRATGKAQFVSLLSRLHLAHPSRSTLSSAWGASARPKPR